MPHVGATNGVGGDVRRKLLMEENRVKPRLFHIFGGIFRGPLDRRWKPQTKITHFFEKVIFFEHFFPRHRYFYINFYCFYQPIISDFSQKNHLRPSMLKPWSHAGELTFISDLLGGATFASSILISPSGILLSAWSMIRRDCLISSTLQRYLCHTERKKNKQTKKKVSKKAMTKNWKLLPNSPLHLRAKR